MSRAPWQGVAHRVRLARVRRPLAAGLAALAVMLGVPEVLARSGAAPATVRVVVAAHDLASGRRVGLADIATVAMPRTLVPAGAVRSTASVRGRTTAGPVRRGEVITDLRLLGPGLLDALGAGSELVAAPVRIADPGAVALLRVGDTVDVLASGGLATDRAPTATVVAPGVQVLAIPSPPTASAFGQTAPTAVDGALLVVAASPDEARALAAAASSGSLSIALRAQP